MSKPVSFDASKDHPEKSGTSVVEMKEGIGMQLSETRGAYLVLHWLDNETIHNILKQWD